MDVEMMFARGREYADSGNYDYAIAIFQDILAQNPDHLRSRIAMRGCVLSRFREKGGGFGAKTGAFLGGLGLFITALTHKSHEKRVAAAEKFLLNYPTNQKMLETLATSLWKLGYGDAAVNTLEFARQQAPENIGILRKLGELYADKEEYRKAVRCYDELARLRPRDRFITDRLKDMQATSHLKTSGIEEAQSYRETIRDEKKAVEMEEESRLIHSADEIGAAIARLQERLKTDQDNPALLIRLGDLYLRKEQFDFARMAYEKAHELRPSYVTEEKIGDLDIRLLALKEAEAAATAAAEPRNAELQARKREMREKRLQMAIATFEARVNQHPTELPLRYKLGMLYCERASEADIGKAISCFQKAVTDPRLREGARFMLGRCFAREPRTRDMAIRQYEQALELAHTPQSERAKDIQFSIGELYEQSGNKEQALNWYKRVLELDAEYRQVAGKVANLSAD